MTLSFINRERELGELDAHARAGGLLVVFGRRRVGKTRLLTRWLERRGGLYSQAIEASRDQQLEQVFADLRGALKTTLTPRSWADLLELLDLEPGAGVVCLDEFPYLVASDPSLPSVLQRWLDHRKRKGASLVLAGSSTRMMNDLVLARSAPLYGRARKLLQVDPMSYRAFCRACRQDPLDRGAFTRFSLVGGVPRYWELVEPRQTPLQLAEALFFGGAPFLEFEPSRLLRDEGLSGPTAQAVLEAVGRGAEKASEIAGRLGTPQTSLSRQFQTLVDGGLLERQLPWGESLRSTKRTLYRIGDPTLRFWFRVYSPHRTRWSRYSLEERQKLLDDHASTVFEDRVRALWPDAARSWEAGVELDLVRSDGVELLVGEVKWSALSKAERAGSEQALRERFLKSQLAARHARVRFEVYDASALRLLAKA